LLLSPKIMLTEKQTAIITTDGGNRHKAENQTTRQTENNGDRV
jgi:hypothetical protein